MPALVMTCTCAPGLRPSTAEKLFETTRTSSTDSVLGVRLVMPPRATPFVLVSSTLYSSPRRAGRSR